jgi:hypothetical protein
MSLSFFFSCAQLTIRPNQMELCNPYFSSFTNEQVVKKKDELTICITPFFIKYHFKLYCRTLSKQKKIIYIYIHTHSHFEYIWMRHSGTNSAHRRETLNVYDDTNVWKRS